MNADQSPANVIELKFPENIKLTEFIQKLLLSRRKAEALRWLSASRLGKRRTIGVLKGAKASIQWVKELYAAGANRVIAADIKTDPAGNQNSAKIIVVLPTDAKQRVAVFQWCKRQAAKIGYLPDVDGGESHMYIYVG